MLISHTTTQYHKRVPIQVGSCIIDQLTNCITEEELQSLSQTWKLAYVSTIISKSSQVSDQEFELEQGKGKVVITKEVKIPAFSDHDHRRADESYGTPKACPCVGGTIPQMYECICSRKYLQINTRRVRCNSST